jgi:glycosyltransferase involved in cell wall biosynthesis
VTARGDSRSIVIVSHICPVPETQGNRRRLATLLRWLRDRGFRLVFVLQPLDWDGPVALPALAELVDEVIVVSRKSRARRLLDGLKSLGRRAADGPDGFPPGSVDAWCWSATCRAVREAVTRTHAVAVISVYVLFSRCLENLPTGVLKIIDTNEVFFRNTERFQVPGLQAPVICTPASEKEGLARADVLLAIQRNDAEALSALLPQKPVITVPHGCGPLPQGQREPTGGTVLYVGSHNPFNVHGLREFLAHSWPRILAERPDATLRVVGKLPQLEGPVPPGVTFVGRIGDDDLAAAYRSSAVVINPQVAGTGLKIKCVEAIGAGCAVVMRKAGADGLEEGAGWAFLVAETWEEFARDVLRLLDDSAFRRAIEQGARTFAERTLSPGAVFAGLEAVLPRST